MVLGVFIDQDPSLRDCGFVYYLFGLLLGIRVNLLSHTFYRNLRSNGRGFGEILTLTYTLTQPSTQVSPTHEHRERTYQLFFRAEKLTRGHFSNIVALILHFD